MRKNTLYQWLSESWNKHQRSDRRRFLTPITAGCESLEDRTLLAAPIAFGDDYATNEDTNVNGMLLGGDADADPITFHKGAILPIHGNVFVNANGMFLYVPNPDFQGGDTFSFFVNDGTSNSEEALVTIQVNGVNDNPVVIDGTGSPSEDFAFPGSLVPLTLEPDGDTLTYSIIDTTSHGTLTLNANGTFTYTPNANFSGPDSFTFTVNDGNADSNVGTFKLNVQPVDDPFTVTFPSGTPQIARTSSPVRIDPAASISDNDSIVDFANTHIRVSIFSGNSNGDAQKGRVSLVILSQQPGPGAVFVQGSNIYYDGQPIPIARFSGGTFGQALTIKFTSAATGPAVNAVMKQISFQASFRAIQGTRQMQYTVTTLKRTAQANKSVNVI